MTALGPPKQRVHDLAALGGPARFGEALHVGRPNIGDRERLHALLDQVLDRRILTNDGPLVREFEERVVEITGASHAVAVVNATVGLGIVARALDLAGEIILPSFTFLGSAHAFDWLGLTPVFCDIKADEPTIDPEMAERLLGPDTCAIAGVHTWGHVCDVDGLAQVGGAHGIPVIYDAAHAFACSAGGRQVGSFGHAEVFSFHATKFINSFEGGVITTDDDEVAFRARRIRNYGFADTDRSDMGGTNAKMHEVSAAMGLTSLEAMPEILRVNRDHAGRYASLLRDVDGISPLPAPPLDEWNAQYIVTRVDSSDGALTRDQLLQILMAENILARRYFYPGCHHLEPYASRPDGLREPLLNTEALAADVLALPTGTAMTAEEVEAVCEIIAFSLRHGHEIGPRLPARDD